MNDPRFLAAYEDPEPGWDTAEPPTDPWADTDPHSIPTDPEAIGGVVGAGEPSQFAVGQSLVADALVARHPGKFMFVPGVGWYLFDGCRWWEGNGMAERRLEQAIVDTARHMVAANESEDHVGAAAKTLASNAQLAGVSEFVARHPDVLTGIHELDADPYRLNCRNGTLDLLTGELHPHNAADRLTKVTNANYNPDAEGPTWGRFLGDALGDRQLVDALAQLFGGVGLVGKVIDHVLPIIYGPGGSGKGTFQLAVSGALGDYALACEPDIIMKTRGAHPTGQMDLLGMRVAFVSESDEGRQLDAATMKRLTGGDKIRARKMRQDFVEFDPSHLLVLVTNHLPVMPAGDDPAVWRRVRVVPFDRPPEKANKRLGDELAGEADAILAWLVAGFTSYWNNGCDIDWPESVTSATAAYRSSSDLLGQWLEETTIKVTDSVTVPMGEAYTRWKAWLAANAPDAKPGRTQDLKRHLVERGESVRAGSSRTKGSVLAGRMFTDDADDG